MSIPLNVTAGQLPAGICNIITDEQSRLNIYAANLSVTFPTTITGINVGTNKPGNDQQDKAWLKLDQNLRPVRMYFFAGTWLSQHPLVPGFTMIWTGALPDFSTFDGGSGGGVTAVSGPMWELNTDIHGTTTPTDARFPVSVGNFASGTVVGVAVKGGEEKHILTTEEMAPHRHGTSSATFWHGNRDGTAMAPSGSNANDPSINTVTTDNACGDPATGNPPTVAAGHLTLPPYVGVYFLRRTGRLFYSES